MRKVNKHKVNIIRRYYYNIQDFWDTIKIPSLRIGVK